VYLFYWGINAGNVWAALGSFPLFIPVFFLSIAIASSFFESDPETKIENELQECMKKHGIQQT
jgi:hypothetical protein